MVNYLTWVHSRLNFFFFFHVFVYLCRFWNKMHIGADGWESTNEVTFYKIISSGEMLKRQSLLMCQSKRNDGMKKWSDGRLKMRREKWNFPTERIIKLNSLWTDTVETKRVTELYKAGIPDIQLEKAASEVRKFKGKRLTTEFFKHLPQKDTELDTSY